MALSLTLSNLLQFFSFISPTLLIFFLFMSSLFNQNLKPYQFYNFTGTNISNFGTDYKWYVKNLILFGEISTDNISKKISATNGLIMSLDKNIDISILYRNFNLKTQPQISNALGEGTDNRNENGFYTGVSLIPFKNYKLNAYSDKQRQRHDGGVTI